jgi:hypothetical protein
VLPVFKELLEDSVPEVRANCALVLPKMIQLVGPEFANILFDDLFFTFLGEKNPSVLGKFLTQIEFAVSVLKQQLKEQKVMI